MLKHPMAFVVCLCLALFTLVACGSGGVGGTSLPATPTVTSSPAAISTVPSPTPTPSSVPFTITSIDMTVTPKSIAGMACGTSVNVVYTATFHAPAHSTDGTVQFLYTVNNGRSTTLASITFGPGETTRTYTFNWSGTLEPDNVYPGLGGVITSSPNEVRSPSVKPAGICTAFRG